MIQDQVQVLDKIVKVFDINLDLKSSLSKVLNYINQLTDIEAISIRFHSQGDYPYFVYRGFSEEFIFQENSLCTKGDNGLNLMEPEGKQFLLECMCGNIIRERTNPKFPFFTENGSFFSNNTTQLLATTNDEDRQSHTRNYCNACGFDSVALIPIRINKNVVGLFQLNDHRKDMFSQDLIKFLEIIGIVLGMLISKYPLFAEYLGAKQNDKKEIIVKICSYCKDINLNKDEWVPVGKNISADGIYTEELKFSHGICPKCFIIQMNDVKILK